jgi:hypothetical protein
MSFLFCLDLSLQGFLFLLLHQPFGEPFAFAIVFSGFIFCTGVIDTWWISRFQQQQLVLLLLLLLLPGIYLALQILDKMMMMMIPSNQIMQLQSDLQGFFFLILHRLIVVDWFFQTPTTTTTQNPFGRIDNGRIFVIPDFWQQLLPKIHLAVQGVDKVVIIIIPMKSETKSAVILSC